MVFKANFARSQRPLQEEPQRQLRQLSLDKCTDGLVSKGKDLLALLFPFVILMKIQVQEINDCVRKHSKYEVKITNPTREAFSLYLNDSW